MKNDNVSVITLKVDSSLKSDFSFFCKKNETDVSKQIRLFMREYVDRHNKKDFLKE